MLHNGPNEVDGIPVEVIRKRIRRYNLRVDADGTVKLSVPKWWGTLRQAEFFLREKWGGCGRCAARCWRVLPHRP